MQKLRCDICGGQIEMQPDKRGLCMNCGTAYSLATMKEMFASVKVSDTGLSEDVEQWRQLLERYLSAGDYDEAERLVKKIMEADPNDKQIANQYEQLQVLKFMDIRNGVLKGYSGSANVLVVPNMVTNIDPKVFAGNDYLEEITLPEGLTVLRHDLFSRCNKLKKVSIPTSVITIEDRCFEYCTSLDHIAIPDNVQYIGTRAFGSCTSLVEVQIPSSVRKIGLLGNGDDSYYNEKSHIESAKGAFSHCTNLKRVFFSQGLKEIGCCTFYNTALEEIILPSGVELIGSHAFSSPALKRLVIPESVTMSHYKCPEGGRESHWYPQYPWGDCPNLESIEYPSRFNPGIFVGTKLYYSKIVPQQMQARRKSEGLCQHCGGTFGFFTGNCKKCGRSKDY